MAIKDLEARQGNVNLVVEIVEKGDIREFEKFGKKGRVCNATVKDATGSIKLTLWNDDIEKVKTGDTIKIDNGWVSEWQGELQLSTGKFGKIELMEKSETVDEVTESKILANKTTDEGEHILTEDEQVEEEVLDDLEEEPSFEEETKEE